MGNRIRELREEKRMTQLRLSMELGVTQETISAYETGKHDPSVKSLLKMRKLFRASMDYIMGVDSVRLPQDKDGLSPEETTLLSLFHGIKTTQREIVITFLRAMQ